VLKVWGRKDEVVVEERSEVGLEEADVMVEERRSWVRQKRKVR